jgi:hypothetical protein
VLPLVGSEVLIAVHLNSTVFLDVTPCTPAEIDRLYEEMSSFSEWEVC